MNEPTPVTSPVHLRAAGVSLVLDVANPAAPVVAHWGADLGDLDPFGLDAVVTAGLPGVVHGAYLGPERPGVLVERLRGLTGPQGIWGRRPGGQAWSPRLRLGRVREIAGGVSVDAFDGEAGLAVTVAVTLTPDGLVSIDVALTNEGPGLYLLERILPALPVPARAAEIVNLSGRWTRERQAERLAAGFGTWVRDGYEGRSGHDFPLALTVTTPGAGWRHGEAWALSLVWSGNHHHEVGRAPDGRRWLAGGEALLPGEVVLEPGHTYRAPSVLAAWSGAGLDGISARFHRHLRRRPRHPARPRPLTLNTWEAVYFDHDLPRLRELASAAAAIGVERFVLDDGWFHRRRDDQRGLGDWWADAERYPDGLAPLAEHVCGLGMEFGLWVEPEMVSPDSDLARAHPDWILQVPGRLPAPWRHQQVLDLSNPDVWDYLVGRLDALLVDLPIQALKWDHNRALADPGDHRGRPAVRAQTLAVLRLMDELKIRHPGLEIESCASGGGRVDLGILEHTDRVWASDSNDPLDRQLIQRWTSLVLPPELIGAHVGPPRAHTTSRATDLGFRCATALFGHAGIEWDILSASPAEREALARWVALYKRLRPILHRGEVVRVDHPDGGALVHGVVADDRSEAVFAYVQMDRSDAALPAAVRLPGLDSGRRYRVTVESPTGEPPAISRSDPPWRARAEMVVPGGALEHSGLAMPALAPHQALVLHLTAVAQ
jgi:alpha-galactosidase